MKILKFGGKSLANGKGIESVLNILTEKATHSEDIYVVLSARGDATDQLEYFLDEAQKGNELADKWEAFKAYQLAPNPSFDLSKEFQLLEDVFQGVRLTRDYSLKVKDLVLAQGEILSIKLISALLNSKGVKSQAVDSRLFLKTDDAFGDAHINKPRLKFS